jgi:hypothetical protein
MERDGEDRIFGQKLIRWPTGLSKITIAGDDSF